MPRDPQRRFRGAAKLIALTLAAGLAGALIGVAVAELTEGDPRVPLATETSTTPAPAATQAAATQTVARPAQTQTQTSTTQTQTQTQTTQTQTSTTIAPSVPVKGFKVPRVEVLSATIGEFGGRPRVTVRVRVTNRRGRALDPEDPVLLEGPDAVPLDDAAKDSAGAVRRALEPGETASGTLRFTLPDAMAERIEATAKAELKIATRTIKLEILAA